jgi:hypothetical protein
MVSVNIVCHTPFHHKPKEEAFASNTSAFAAHGDQ